MGCACPWSTHAQVKARVDMPKSRPLRLVQGQADVTKQLGYNFRDNCYTIELASHKFMEANIFLPSYSSYLFVK